MTLEQKIEALLFFKGEPQTFSELAAALHVDLTEIHTATHALSTTLSGRGITLVTHGDKVMLGTPADMSELFEQLRKEELEKTLSKAALETLSIILYRDGVSRGEINFIRGVNSGFILRSLEVRGLVEKLSDPRDARTYVYKPTLELLSFLGVGSVNELPDFDEVKKTLETRLTITTAQDESIA